MTKVHLVASVVKPGVNVYSAFRSSERPFAVPGIVIPATPVGFAVLVKAGKGQWLLNDVVVLDYCRRRGYGMGILDALDTIFRCEKLGACWVSKAGASLALAWIKASGKRPPLWEIGIDENELGEIAAYCKHVDGVEHMTRAEAQRLESEIRQGAMG